MKRSVIIGAAVGVLVLAVGGVGYAAYRVNAQGDEQERKAEVIAAANVVDDELVTIWSELESCDKQWEMGVNNGTAVDLIDVYNSTRDTVTDLKDDVAEVRTLVEDIPSESVQDQYLEVCDLLDTALDESLRQADAAAPYIDASSLLEGALGNRDAGLSAINASIQACNAKNWTEGKQYAATAQEQYQAVRDAFGQAATLSGCPEVEAACPWADALVAYAAEQHELATLGSKGAINSYNSQISKLDDLEIQIDELTDLAGIAEGTLWQEADDVYGHFQLEATDAKRAWTEAKDAVTAGDV